MTTWRFVAVGGRRKPAFKVTRTAGDRVQHLGTHLGSLHSAMIALGHLFEPGDIVETPEGKSIRGPQEGDRS